MARRLHLPPALLRRGVHLLGKRCLDPALPWPVQRARLERLTRNALLPKGTRIGSQDIGGVPTVVIGDGAATVIHFHGGGYCVGSPQTTQEWGAHLSARARCRVVLPRYRLAPEHPYPAALDDARAVYAAITAAGTGPVLLSGDSAGGGLALALTLWLRDEAMPLPAGCILLSPWLDLGLDRRADPCLVRKDVLLTPEWLHACARAYAGAGLTDPQVSPSRAKPDGLPPLLIQAGTDELLVPDADLLAASASAAGVDVTYSRWPRMWHDFALQPGLLAAADSAADQAAWFTRAVTGCAE